MGRHTKSFEGDDTVVEDGQYQSFWGDAYRDADQEEQERQRQAQAERRSFVKVLARVPLLPVVALVLAIGAVSYAYGTSQISLNFSGGPPQAGPPSDPQQDAVTGRNRSKVSRESARTSGPVVAFRVSKKLPKGFIGTATIMNRGNTAIQGWRLDFKIPGVKVTSVQNAIVIKKGKAAYLRNRAETPSLPPGASIRITYTARGPLAKVSACRLNRVKCVMV
jgi:Cellulose binding domain